MRIQLLLFVFFVHTLLMGSQVPENIAQKFTEQGGIESDEPISLKTFSEIAADATPEEPFFLAVVPALSTYVFFYFPELIKYWKTKDFKSLKNPINNLPVTLLFLYKYNNSNTEFPFDYVEMLTEEEIKKRYSNAETVESWLVRVKRETAQWIIDKLFLKFRKPTKEDLRQVYRILGISIDEEFINLNYQDMLSETNRINRYLLSRAQRRYNDARLRNFIINRGFPLDDQTLINLYNDEHSGRASRNILLTYNHLGRMYYYAITAH